MLVSKSTLTIWYAANIIGASTIGRGTPFRRQRVQSQSGTLSGSRKGSIVLILERGGRDFQKFRCDKSRATFL